MDEGYRLSEEAIRQIQSLPSLIRREVDFRMRQATTDRVVEPTRVRVARTCSHNYPYPSDPANNYEVRFVEPSFDDETVGLDTLSVTELGDDLVRVAHSIVPIYLDENSDVLIQLSYGQWYIVTERLATQIQFEIKSVEGSEATALVTEIPYGCQGVPLMNGSNEVTVKDTTEELTLEEEMIGFATLVQALGEQEPYWSIHSLVCP